MARVSAQLTSRVGSGWARKRLCCHLRGQPGVSIVSRATRALAGAASATASVFCFEPGGLSGFGVRWVQALEVGCVPILALAPAADTGSC